MNPLASICRRPAVRNLSAFLGVAVVLSALPSVADVAGPFGQVPLWFERNAGQADERFPFISHGASHSIYLSPTETWVALQDPVSRPQPGIATDATVSATVSSSRWLQLSLIGANPLAPAHAGQPLSGRVNHIAGPPSEWVTGVAAFGRIQFNGVYPGIDLVFYGNQRRFEYDFLVAPGVRPDRIAWRIDGADRLEIDGRGDLVLHAGKGAFRQHRPVAHQIIRGERREVEARFVLGPSNGVSFALGHYDSAAALVIDPVLSLDYSTYLGGEKVDRAWAVAADASGNVYIAGDTFLPPKNVPALGTLTNFNGGTKYGGDAFVAKLDATGTNFVYFTYLGGSSIDVANAIAVDGSGAAYVAGLTVSTNFPVFPAGALQPAIAGTNIADFNVPHADAFVTKLDAAGVPVYSTYLGGEVDDAALAIAVDSAGRAHVTGYTESALVFRVTNEVRTTTCTNVFLTNLVCGAEVVRTNITTARLLVPVTVVTNVTRSQFSRADPPELTNEVWSIVTTTLLGSEKLTDGFPIVNAVQTNNAGGADIFIATLSADGTSLFSSTYLGGVVSRDFGTGIGVDAGGAVTISGVADDADFPTTNALQSVFGGGRDAVAARLDPSGSSLIYATYLGGSLNDLATGLAAGPDGSAYLVGSTASRDFLTTAGSIRPGGVFQSTDAGASWAPRSTGLTHTGVRALAVHPVSPSTLYAGTPRGVFQTADAGATWRSSSDDVAGLEMTALAIDPLTPATVYAGGPDGFYRSDDSGVSWTLFGSGLPFTTIGAITFDPVNPDTIHVGNRLGYFVSTNRGTNFIKAGQGLKSRVVHRLVVTPSNAALIYAGTDGGVFQSTNAGLNWRPINTGLATRRVLALAMSPSSPDTLIAGTPKGIYRTVDAGASWTSQTNGMGRPQVEAVVYDPTDSAVVFAACTNGLFRSTNGGQTWASATNGLLTRDLVSLAINPASPATLYAGARGTNFSGGTNDAFLLKLAPDGQSLSYAFTFGGTRTDEARAVAVDDDGNAFVAGITLSRNFPVVGPVPGTRWQGTNSGKTDVFIAQFDPTGSSNVFSIHLGGRGNDTATSIALDGLGGIYVAGYTKSLDFVTTNAVQRTRVGEKEDAFVTKLTVGTPAGAARAPVPASPAGAVIEFEVRRGANPGLPFPPIILAPRVLSPSPH